MTFYNKIKWVLGILIVFVLIVATNLIDRNNFVRVKESVETIYEDRLIAKDLIFEMSQAVQEKELALVQPDTVFFKSRNAKVNQTIQGLIGTFETTKLTKEESAVFDTLKNNFKKLKDEEAAFATIGFADKKRVAKRVAEINGNLQSLSDIQITEGKRQMSITKRALDTVELFTQIEIYILVFLAIIIQIIVMYKPKGDV
ncbi:MCP four helix bundle domain-containing protein [Tamlana crocina]|uniref:Chemotaxis protein n=1 Tax=Tamlana crocina TaxID=393006 RepID=A0ABX1DE45_9FLAO|nr:MCP four helix bundle domain-containing protein [Tamlana crocina]NJX16535.1 chemotaxis protein [Tamlana crocina]